MSDATFFFGGRAPVLRILVVGTFAYGSLITLQRISGKRTLSQMNAFDFLITVALGASFGRILTARNVALAEAVTAFALLMALQFAGSGRDGSRRCLRRPRRFSSTEAISSALKCGGKELRKMRSPGPFAKAASGPFKTSKRSFWRQMETWRSSAPQRQVTRARCQTVLAEAEHASIPPAQYIDSRSSARSVPISVHLAAPWRLALIVLNGIGLGSPAQHQAQPVP